MMTKSLSMLTLSTLTIAVVTSGCTSNLNSSAATAAANADVKSSTTIKPNLSIDNIVPPTDAADSDDERYAKFFTYPYINGMEIQPAMGGTLVIKDNCLLIQNGDRFSIPVFPHGITTWNKSTQVLTANGIDIPLNTDLFTNGPLNGGEYDPNYDYNFVQQADPKCLEGRYIEFLGSQFMDVKKFSNR